MKNSIKGNIIAICLIIFLSTFIILPPTIRAFLPKEETTVPTTKVKMLKCSKEVDNLVININTLYTDDIITKTNILFTLKEEVIDEENKKEPITIDKLENEELLLLKKDPNIKLEYKDNTIKTTLLYTNTFSEDVTSKYKQNYFNLKEHFTDYQYLCTTVK